MDSPQSGSDLPALDALGAALRRAAVRTQMLAPCCGRPDAYCYCAEDRARYEENHMAYTDPKQLLIPGDSGSFYLDDSRNYRDDTDAPREFRKTATIRAQQITEPFIVRSKEGDHAGKPGDWLAQGPAGELWVIDQEIFANTYEPFDGDA